MINILIIGAGYIGKIHILKSDLNYKCKIVGIVEPSLEIQQILKSKYKEIPFFNDVSEIPIDRYDAGLVLVPTKYHYRIVKYLLQYRKHVFCEKPLCENLYSLNKLKKYIDPDIIFQIGHSERYHDIFSKNYQNNIWNLANDIISDKKALVKFSRLAPFKGRGLDVDITLDIMIHDIDIANLLFSLYLYPKDKYKIVATNMIKTCNTLDHVDVYIEGNPNIQFEAGRGYHSEKREFTIWSEHGVLHYDLIKRELNITRDGKLTDTIIYNFSDNINKEQNEFYDCITNKTIPTVNIEVAEQALQVLDYIHN